MSSSFQTEIVSLQTALCVAGESMKDPNPGDVSLAASVLLGLKQTEEANESPKTKLRCFEYQMNYSVGCRHCVYICFPLKFLVNQSIQRESRTPKLLKSKPVCPAHGFVWLFSWPLFWALVTVELNVVQTEEGRRPPRFSLPDFSLFVPWVTCQGNPDSTKPALCSPRGWFCRCSHLEKVSTASIILNSKWFASWWTASVPGPPLLSPFTFSLASHYSTFAKLFPE